MNKNKRNLLSIFIILICMLSICNSVFAYTTKRTGNSYISDAMRYVAPNNLTDIQIDSVFAERSGNNCAITVSFTKNIPTMSSGNRKLYPHFLISIPQSDKSKYPNTMDAFVKSDDSAIERTATSNGMFLSKLIYGKQKYVINAPMNFCNNNSGKIDLYVFIPNNWGFGAWDNVKYYDGERIGAFDLKSDSSYLGAVDLRPSYGALKARYFYNLDYAYDVPVQNNQEQSVPKEQTNVTASVKNESKQVKAKAECDASFVSVSGYPYKYKCNEDRTRYIVCINGKIENDYKFRANSPLKAVLCPESQTEKTTTKVTQQSTPQKTLAIELGGYIPEISFSLDNTTWYKVNKIDSPNAFVLESKAQNKTISIDLSMLNTGTVYAIITTADKKTDLDSKLKEIYQTATFTGYVKDTPSNPFTINNVNMPAKVEYTLDDSKHIKLKIAKESQLENIVLVFMQKSTDHTKVTIVYTNLYDLNSKSQSLFNLCQINKKIVNFYCTGYDCKSNASCLPSGRWDFDSKILEGLTPKAVTTTPEPQATLEKGADGCYSSNPATLAKIRQEGGIGITKPYFNGKRTMNSIVLPNTDSGTDDDPSLTVEQIREIFNRKGTNIPQKVKDASPSFYNLGLIYNIDPVFVLSIFKAEKSLFNLNSGSITEAIVAKNDVGGVSVCRCGGVKAGTYCSYPTLEQGIEAVYLNLSKGTTYNPNIYRNKSFSSVARTWSGKDSYVTAMAGYLADNYRWAGK